MAEQITYVFGEIHLINIIENIITLYEAIEKGKIKISSEELSIHKHMFLLIYEEALRLAKLEMAHAKKLQPDILFIEAPSEEDINKWTNWFNKSARTEKYAYSLANGLYGRLVDKAKELKLKPEVSKDIIHKAKMAIAIRTKIFQNAREIYAFDAPGSRGVEWIFAIDNPNPTYKKFTNVLREGHMFGVWSDKILEKNPERVMIICGASHALSLKEKIEGGGYIVRLLINPKEVSKIILKYKILTDDELIKLRLKTEQDPEVRKKLFLKFEELRLKKIELGLI